MEAILGGRGAPDRGSPFLGAKRLSAADELIDERLSSKGEETAPLIGPTAASALPSDGHLEAAPPEAALTVAMHTVPYFGACAGGLGGSALAGEVAPAGQLGWGATWYCDCSLVMISQSRSLKRCVGQFPDCARDRCRGDVERVCLGDRLVREVGGEVAVAWSGSVDK